MTRWPALSTVVSLLLMLGTVGVCILGWVDYLEWQEWYATDPMPDEAHREKRAVVDKIAEGETVPECNADLRYLIRRFLRTHRDAEVIVKRSNCLRVNKVQK